MSGVGLLHISALGNNGRSSLGDIGLVSVRVSVARLELR